MTGAAVEPETCRMNITMALGKRFGGHLPDGQAEPA